MRKYLFLFGIALLLPCMPSASAIAQTWTHLAPTGGPPALRGFHGTRAVYDASTNRMTIFAGMSTTFGVPYNDVWVLTDANGLGGTPTWMNLIPNGTPGAPPPRAGHTAVYDPNTNRMITFGGCRAGCEPVLNDVWVLEHANGLGGTPTWTQLSPTGGPPTGRQRHTAVYDPATNRMMVWTGQNGSGNGCAVFSDLWVLEHANGLGGTPTWTQLSPTGALPPGRYGPSAVYDSANNRMTVFGGGCPGGDAVWVLEHANGLGGTPNWTTLIPEGTPGSPPVLSFHTAVLDAASNQMTIFGGSNQDVWVLDHANGLGGTAFWTQLSPTGGPPPQTGSHAAVLDAASNRMTIFGGNAGTQLLNETWVLSDVRGLPPGLVSWWPADGHPEDLVGGQDGTLQNGATYANRRVGQAFRLDGIDDYIAIPNLGVNGNAARTVEALIRPEDLARQMIFTHGTADTDGNSFDFEAGTPPGGSPGNIALHDFGCTHQTTSGILPANQFSHVAVTYDGSTVPGGLTFYINGVPQPHTSVGSPARCQAAPLNSGTMDYQIGSRIEQGTRQLFFGGRIDEVRVYNRALSAAEIQALSDGSLPVELISFEALANDPDVVLRWQTATETNNAGFEVQHKPVHVHFDGEIDPRVGWQTVAFINGHGTTIEQQNYTYRAHELAAGHHLFRLKQIDFDGAFEFSPVLEVVVEVPGTHGLSPAYPNPFESTAQFSLIVRVEQPVKVSVYDLQGRLMGVIFEGALEANRVYLIAFEGASWPSGTYVYEAVGAYFRDRRMVTVVK